MLLGTKKTLHDLTTEALLEKQGSVADIQTFLKTQNTSASVQGIYKALRELIAEDIVVKQKKSYAINSVWRGKIANLVSERTRLTLSAGEQTIYRFRKLDHLDAFWKHTLADIESETKQFPVFHFTPHQFWSFVPGRTQSEFEYYQTLNKEKVHAYTIVGGETMLDKDVKKILASLFHQVHLDATVSFNRRDHISAIGPYVVITRISKTLAEKTDELYEKITEESLLKENLAGLFKNPGSIIMIVEHNESKAKKLRKMMAKNFYIPSELKEKFDLF